MQSEGSFGIPEGSTVLVTGVNGFIGSHVCSQLLQLGFDVRGTVRDPTKYAWVEDLMERDSPKGCFTLASLPDLEDEGAFDSLVDGVSAVIHVASPVSLSPDPESVIPSSINGAMNALKAANRSPTVKRFVLTSSSVAAALPKPGQKEHFVDVEDTARLHVACAVLPEVQGERVFAWAEPFNFDAVLDILRSEFPSKHFVENFHNYRDLSTAEKAKSRAAQLLRRMGRNGFTSLEKSVLLNVDDLP
ncbi:Aldehyde reductase 2 [Colletotrichum sp. SAR 10_99]|nr:Aldehyde reductase 2 [Colletotrichum sp. SAR 10_96]KAI8255269.1 Aldehyde reductase 2 [Colletotrichum sp. SAR 10_98]KAJ5010199.1 Aldehyde reductase 2 [Colletotrichum sp. SAR 10_99]